MGRGRRRLHRAEAGTASGRRRTDRPLPAVSRQLQDSSTRRVLRNRAAEERLWKDPEEIPAGAILDRPETGGGLIGWANLCDTSAQTMSVPQETKTKDSSDATR